jgi:hypothetical protein
MTKIEDDYNGMKTELQSKNQPHLFQLAVKEKNLSNNLKQSSTSSMNFNEYPKYAYEQLIKPVEELPSDIINESREVKILRRYKLNKISIFLMNFFQQ